MNVQNYWTESWKQSVSELAFSAKWNNKSETWKLTSRVSQWTPRTQGYINGRNSTLESNCWRDAMTREAPWNDAFGTSGNQRNGWLIVKKSIIHPSLPTHTGSMASQAPSVVPVENPGWRRRRQAYAKSCSTPTTRTLRLLADYIQGRLPHSLSVSMCLYPGCIWLFSPAVLFPLTCLFFRCLLLSVLMSFSVDANFWFLRVPLYRNVCSYLLIYFSLPAR